MLSRTIRHLLKTYLTLDRMQYGVFVFSSYCLLFFPLLNQYLYDNRTFLLMSLIVNTVISFFKKQENISLGFLIYLFHLKNYFFNQVMFFPSNNVLCNFWLHPANDRYYPPSSNHVDLKPRKAFDILLVLYHYPKKILLVLYGNH